MASYIECNQKHGYSSPQRCLSFVREWIKTNKKPVCKKCGSEFNYYMEFRYPVGGRSEFEVIQVIPIEKNIEEERYYPVLFILKDKNTGVEALWPFYWTKNRKGNWALGQYPPLLTKEGIEEALKKVK